MKQVLHESDLEKIIKGPSLRLADLIAAAGQFIAATPANRLYKTDRPMFLPPIAGAQRADHPVFRKLQDLLPGHLLPADMFTAALPGPLPETLSVVSFSFPVHPDTVKENSREKIRPSESWLRTRAESDALFRDLAQELLALLQKQNIRAMHTQTSVLYKVGWNKGAPLAANWSERHVGYACGLGTFGLHHGLITAHGAAHRLMSFIIAAECDQYNQVSENPFAGCLYLTRGKCGACIQRCPAKAITKDGLDLAACRKYSYEDMVQYSQDLVGKATGGCALCMCGVPCSMCDPVFIIAKTAR
jgi:ferredoxin